MGALTLPSAGSVYLDTRIHLQCGASRAAPHRTLLEPMWRLAGAGQFAVVSSELTLLETLVKPLRENDAVLAHLFRTR